MDTTSAIAAGLVRVGSKSMSAAPTRTLAGVTPAIDVRAVVTAATQWLQLIPVISRCVRSMIPARVWGVCKAARVMGPGQSASRD